MIENKPVALSIKVLGRVQGVFFRAFTRREAILLGITGYVRNLSDGSVEVYAEGETDKLKNLEQRLQQGPSRASVSQVITTHTSYTGNYDSFQVK